MRYTPYTEAEIQSMNVMDEGVYAFQVVDVITENNNNMPLVDKNGNDLAKLKLLVWDKDQRERIIYTFISGDGNFAYKLRHFAKTIGLLATYETGELNIHKTVGLSGKAEIVIKKGTLKNDGSGEMWPDRNDVKDFVCDSNLPITPALNKSNPDNLSKELDDDIPF